MSRLVASLNELSGFFRHGHDRQIGISADYCWHDRAIDDSEVVYPPNPQLTIDNSVAVYAHTAGAYWMIDRFGPRSYPFFAGGYTRKRIDIDLSLHKFAQTRLIDNLA